MRFSTFILQLTICGILVAIATIVGSLGHFFLFGGQVFLLPAIVFLFPLILRIYFLPIACSCAVVLTDFFNGWIAFTWISLIAYNLAVLAIWVIYKSLRLMIFYRIAIIAAAALLIAAFYLLEIRTFGQAYAIKDAIATSIEMAICIPIIWILSWPVHIVAKVVKIV